MYNIITHACTRTCVQCLHVHMHDCSPSTLAASPAGYQTAVCLAKAGAHVVLACRSTLRADQAAGRILKAVVRVCLRA